MKNSKKGQGAVMGVILVVLFTALVGGFFYFGSKFTTQQTALGSPAVGLAPDTSTGAAQVATLCPDSGVVLTLSSFDAVEKGTATGERHTVWVKNGLDANGKTIWKRHTIVTDTGTTSVGGGSIIKVLWGNSSENREATAFYPALLDEYQVGCVDQTLNGYQKDRNSTAISVNFFNSDDGLINTVADTEVMAANAVNTLTMKMAGTSNDYFGDGMVNVVFDANVTAYEKITVLSGTERKTQSSIPTQHAGVAGARAYAYELPELFGSAFVAYSVEVDATGTDPANNVSVRVYDRCSFINADTDTVEQAYNDEDNNDLCSNNGIQSIAIS